jgi:hypothetical protein
MSEFATSNDNGLKLARRARIARQYRELDGTIWSAEEDGYVEEEVKILKRLAIVRQMVGSQEFSEDEDEDDDDSEEEDEANSEEDEWEDEDDEHSEDDPGH